MKYNPITRRAFLQGLGGMTLSIPVLGSLLPRECWAQAANSQMKFAFVGARWGRDITKWYPAADPTKVSPEGVYHELLSAYTPFSPILDAEWNSLRGKISILRGLDGMDAYHDGHNPGIALTGSGSGPTGLGFGYSIDAILEESSKIYPVAPYAGAIRSSVHGNGNGQSTSYTSRSGTLQTLLSTTNVMDIYSKNFSPDYLAKSGERAGRQKLISNLVMEDFTAMKNSRKIAAADKSLLDNYMSILNDAEIKLGLAKPNCPTAPGAPGAITSASVLHDVAMDLEIAALLCGMTKVVVHWVLQHNEELIYNDGEAHSAAHNGRSVQAESGRAPVDQWEMNRWVATRAARFMKKMDAVADPSGRGTLLDNTFCLYSNLESRGTHSFYDMPVVVAGGGGKIRLGYYMDFRPRPLNRKGDDSNIAFGRPYNNLLITAMKSFGLGPADYEKFGQVGFGVYDKYQSQSLAAHYAPFTTVAARNATLPFLYMG